MVTSASWAASTDESGRIGLIRKEGMRLHVYLGLLGAERSTIEVSSSVRDWLLGWEVIRLAEVRLQEGESLENALRRFKRKVQQEDIIKEVRRHSFYLKPGEKKRVKEALARKRARKKSRKESD